MLLAVASGTTVVRAPSAAPSISSPAPRGMSGSNIHSFLFCSSWSESPELGGFHPRSFLLTAFWLFAASLAHAREAHENPTRLELVPE